jgi:hypothetical protein
MVSCWDSGGGAAGEQRRASPIVAMRDKRRMDACAEREDALFGSARDARCEMAMGCWTWLGRESEAESEAVSVSISRMMSGLVCRAGAGRSGGRGVWLCVWAVSLALALTITTFNHYLYYVHSPSVWHSPSALSYRHICSLTRIAPRVKPSQQPPQPLYCCIFLTSATESWHSHHGFFSPPHSNPCTSLPKAVAIQHAPRMAGWSTRRTSERLLYDGYAPVMSVLYRRYLDG